MGIIICAYVALYDAILNVPSFWKTDFFYKFQHSLLWVKGIHKKVMKLNKLYKTNPEKFRKN